MIDFTFEKNEFIAIKVSQPFQDFYSVIFEADFLLKRSYTRVADIDGADVSGTQRKITNKRLNEISEYIDSGEATFPGSVIIAVNYDEYDKLVEEDDRWTVEELDKEKGVYKLTVPNDKKVCSVVDGQHRLFSFAKSENRNMQLQCSVFIDLIPSFQASVFATVNFNQSPVDKSIAYNLFGYQLDKIQQKYWSPDLLALNLCRYFSQNESSFFYGHINYRLPSKNTEKGCWSISTASFVDGVLSLVSGNPKKDRYAINKKELLSLAGRKSISNDSRYGLRNLFKEGNDEGIKQVIEKYFDALRDVFGIVDDSDNVLTKTIGIKACFDFLNEVLLSNELNSELLSNFPELLKKAASLPITDNEFYPSSTKGQTRLLNSFKYKVLEIPLEEVISARSSDTPKIYIDALG